MNSSVVVKSLIGIGVAGGIAGGSAYALMPSNTKNVIAEKLTKEKYTILTSDATNKSKWTEIIDSYKKITNAPQNALKFEGLKGNETDAVAKLQKICSDLLKPSKDETLNESNYKKAEKWCVEPITLSDLFNKRNKKVLSVDLNNKQEDEQKWKSKITLHRDSKNANKRISDLSVGTNEAINETYINNIKTKCKEIGDQKNHQEKYQENMISFEFWCSE